MSDDADRSRRRLGRILVGTGIVIMLIGVLRMNARAIGGPPEQTRDFASRRTDYQVRSEVHKGFPEFLAFTITGFGILLFGAHKARGPQE